jgi:hypothetical protein
MDEVRQLGQLLAQYATSEEHRKQQFEQQCADWYQTIGSLFDQIEAWLAPLTAEGQMTITRQPWQASNAQFPAPDSPFRTEKMILTLALRTVELVPEAMGPKGSIQVAVGGLTSDRHGSISLINTPPSAQWQWRKERGAKDPEVTPLTADMLAVQLQALVPRSRA